MIKRSRQDIIHNDKQTFLPKRKNGKEIQCFVLSTIISSCLTFLAQPFCLALPEGYNTVSGNVKYSTTNSKTLNVNSSSTRSIVNYQKFNIGSDETVNFNLPNSQSTILNRVVGNSSSQIFGKINSNGQVFLINPSGILFGKTSQINVHSLVASTRNITNNDFLNKNYKFTRLEGFSNDKIENSGTVNTKGYVVFAGSSVTNQGSINAPQGSVNIAVGDELSVNISDNIKVNITVDKPLQEKITDAQDAVKNIGTISADTVKVHASLGNNILSNAINNEGCIKASGAVSKNGVVELIASFDSGNAVINNTGTIDVSGSASSPTAGKITIQGDKTINNGSLLAKGAAKGKGGSVQVLGNEVTLSENAYIDVSGDIGGGTALIGGDYQGNGSVLNSKFTIVNQGAVINADAITSGNGGKVIVWADDTTKYYGNITARGGSLSGNGGFLEVSGKNILKFYGKTDLSAKNGSYGSLLLDPTTFSIPGDMTEEALEASAATAIVTINADDGITMDSADNLFNLQLTTGYININADYNNDGIGTFTMDTADMIRTEGGNINISGAILNPGSLNTRGAGNNRAGGMTITATDQVNIANGVTLTAGGNISIVNNTGSINLLSGSLLTNSAGTIVLQGKDINLNANSSIAASSHAALVGNNIAGTITMDGASSISSATGSVYFGANTNNLMGSGSIVINSGATISPSSTLYIRTRADGSHITLGSLTIAKPITVTTNNFLSDITLTGNLNVTGTASITSGRSLSINSGLTLNSTGALTLSNNNSTTTTDSLNFNKTIVSSGGSITINNNTGTINIGDADSSNASSITASGTNVTTAKSINLNAGSSVSSTSNYTSLVGCDSAGTITIDGTSSISSGGTYNVYVGYGYSGQYGYGDIIIKSGATLSPNSTVYVQTNYDDANISIGSLTLSKSLYVSTLGKVSDITLTGNVNTTGGNLTFNAGKNVILDPNLTFSASGTFTLSNNTSTTTAETLNINKTAITSGSALTINNLTGTTNIGDTLSSTASSLSSTGGVAVVLGKTINFNAGSSISGYSYATLSGSDAAGTITIDGTSSMSSATGAVYIGQNYGNANGYGSIVINSGATLSPSTTAFIQTKHDDANITVGSLTLTKPINVSTGTYLADITFTGSLNTTGTATITSGRNVFINPNVTLNSSNTFALTVNNSTTTTETFTLDRATLSSGSNLSVTNNTGLTTVMADSNITTSGAGSITVSGKDITVKSNSSMTGASNVNIVGNDATGTITVEENASLGSTGGSVYLGETSGSAYGYGDITVDSGAVFSPTGSVFIRTQYDDANITIGNLNLFKPLVVTTNTKLSDITMTGNISTSSTIQLTSGKNITINPNLTCDATGSITLTGTDLISLGSGTSVTSGSTISITNNTGTTDINSMLTSTAGNVTTTGKTINLNAGASLTAGGTAGLIGTDSAGTITIDGASSITAGGTSSIYIGQDSSLNNGKGDIIVKSGATFTPGSGTAAVYIRTKFDGANITVGNLGSLDSRVKNLTISTNTNLSDINFTGNIYASGAIGITAGRNALFDPNTTINSTGNLVFTTNNSGVTTETLTLASTNPLASTGGSITVTNNTGITNINSTLTSSTSSVSVIGKTINLNSGASISSLSDASLVGTDPNGAITVDGTSSISTSTGSIRIGQDSGLNNGKGDIFVNSGASFSIGTTGTLYIRTKYDDADITLGDIGLSTNRAKQITVSTNGYLGNITLNGDIYSSAAVTVAAGKNIIFGDGAAINTTGAISLTANSNVTSAENFTLGSTNSLTTTGAITIINNSLGTTTFDSGTTISAGSSGTTFTNGAHISIGNTTFTGPLYVGNYSVAGSDINLSGLLTNTNSYVTLDTNSISVNASSGISAAGQILMLGRSSTGSINIDSTSTIATTTGNIYIGANTSGQYGFGSITIGSGATITPASNGAVIIRTNYDGAHITVGDLGTSSARTRALSINTSSYLSDINLNGNLYTQTSLTLSAGRNILFADGAYINASGVTSLSINNSGSTNETLNLASNNNISVSSGGLTVTNNAGTTNINSALTSTSSSVTVQGKTINLNSGAGINAYSNASLIGSASGGTITVDGSSNVTSSSAGVYIGESSSSTLGLGSVVVNSGATLTATGTGAIFIRTQNDGANISVGSLGSLASRVKPLTISTGTYLSDVTFTGNIYSSGVSAITSGRKISFTPDSALNSSGNIGLTLNNNPLCSETLTLASGNSITSTGGGVSITNNTGITDISSAITAGLGTAVIQGKTINLNAGASITSSSHSVITGYDPTGTITIDSAASINTTAGGNIHIGENSANNYGYGSVLIKPGATLNPSGTGIIFVRTQYDGANITLGSLGSSGSRVKPLTVSTGTNLSDITIAGDIYSVGPVNITSGRDLIFNPNTTLNSTGAIAIIANNSGTSTETFSLASTNPITATNSSISITNNTGTIDVNSAITSSTNYVSLWGKSINLNAGSSISASGEVNLSGVAAGGTIVIDGASSITSASNIYIGEHSVGAWGQGSVAIGSGANITAGTNNGIYVRTQHDGANISIGSLGSSGSRIKPLTVTTGNNLSDITLTGNIYSSGALNITSGKDLIFNPDVLLNSTGNIAITANNSGTSSETVSLASTNPITSTGGSISITNNTGITDISSALTSSTSSVSVWGKSINLKSGTSINAAQYAVLSGVDADGTITIDGSTSINSSYAVYIGQDLYDNYGFGSIVINSGASITSGSGFALSISTKHDGADITIGDLNATTRYLDISNNDYLSDIYFTGNLNVSDEVFIKSGKNIILGDNASINAVNGVSLSANRNAASAETMTIGSTNSITSINSQINIYNSDLGSTVIDSGATLSSSSGINIQDGLHVSIGDLNVSKISVSNDVSGSDINILGNMSSTSDVHIYGSDSTVNISGELTSIDSNIYVTGDYINLNAGASISADGDISLAGTSDTGTVKIEGTSSITSSNGNVYLGTDEYWWYGNGSVIVNSGAVISSSEEVNILAAKGITLGSLTLTGNLYAEAGANADLKITGDINSSGAVYVGAGKNIEFAQNTGISANGDISLYENYGTSNSASLILDSTNSLISTNGSINIYNNNFGSTIINPDATISSSNDINIADGLHVSLGNLNAVSVNISNTVDESDINILGNISATDAIDITDNGENSTVNISGNLTSTNSNVSVLGGSINLNANKSISAHDDVSLLGNSTTGIITIDGTSSIVSSAGDIYIGADEFMSYGDGAVVVNSGAILAPNGSTNINTSSDGANITLGSLNLSKPLYVCTYSETSDINLTGNITSSDDVYIGTESSILIDPNVTINTSGNIALYADAGIKVNEGTAGDDQVNLLSENDLILYQTITVPDTVELIKLKGKDIVPASNPIVSTTGSVFYEDTSDDLTFDQTLVDALGSGDLTIKSANALSLPAITVSGRSLSFEAPTISLNSTIDVGSNSVGLILDSGSYTLTQAVVNKLAANNISVSVLSGDILLGDAINAGSKVFSLSAQNISNGGFSLSTTGNVTLTDISGGLELSNNLVGTFGMGNLFVNVTGLGNNLTLADDINSGNRTLTLTSENRINSGSFKITTSSDLSMTAVSSIDMKIGGAGSVSANGTVVTLFGTSLQLMTINTSGNLDLTSDSYTLASGANINSGGTLFIKRATNADIGSNELNNILSVTTLNSDITIGDDNYTGSITSINSDFQNQNVNISTKGTVSLTGITNAGIITVDNGLNNTYDLISEANGVTLSGSNLTLGKVFSRDNISLAYDSFSLNSAEIISNNEIGLSKYTTNNNFVSSELNDFLSASTVGGTLTIGNNGYSGNITSINSNFQNQNVNINTRGTVSLTGITNAGIITVDSGLNNTYDSVSEANGVTLSGSSLTLGKVFSKTDVILVSDNFATSCSMLTSGSNFTIKSLSEDNDITSAELNSISAAANFGGTVTIGDNDFTGGIYSTSLNLDGQNLNVNSRGIVNIVGLLNSGIVTVDNGLNSAFDSDNEAENVTISSVVLNTGKLYSKCNISLTGADDSTINDNMQAMGTITVNSTGNLAINGNINSSSVLILNNGGISHSDITIANGKSISTTGSGNSLVISTVNGNFINNSDDAALSASSGRWLVYSSDPASTVKGGLIASKLYNKIYSDNVPNTIPSGNYMLYSIRPTLTITADSKSRTYGASNPTFTGSVTGFIDGDTLSTATSDSLTYTSSATVTSNVNSYAITPSAVSNLGYALNYVNGTLEVTPAPLTVIAQNTSKIYGSSNPTFGVNYAGFVNNDSSTSLTGSLGFTTSANSLSPTGSYTVTPSGLSSNNYSISYQDGFLTVTPKSITVTGTDITKVYESADPVLTAHCSELVGNDTLSSLGTITMLTNATQASGPGSNYYIRPTGPASTANYIISYVDGHLTITPRVINTVIPSNDNNAIIEVQKSQNILTTQLSVTLQSNTINSSNPNIIVNSQLVIPAEINNSNIKNPDIIINIQHGTPDANMPFNPNIQNNNQTDELNRINLSQNDSDQI